MLGLKWSDLDLTKGTLKVLRSFDQHYGPAQEKAPKRAASRRSVRPARSAHARRLSKDAKGRKVFKRTKTEKGRSVSLMPEVVEALRAHRRRQAEERLRYAGVWHDQDLIFPNKTGAPMDWDNLTARGYKPLRAKAGLPETTRFYDLRHTFATLMLEQGENPKVVQEILGHSQITHTMDTYSHVTPNMQREAFARLGQRLK